MVSHDDDEIAHLKVAMERRTTIGIALGMVMLRYDIGQDEAFAYLQRISSKRETKLYDVARSMVEVRKVPDEPLD